MLPRRRDSNYQLARMPVAEIGTSFTYRHTLLTRRDTYDHRIVRESRQYLQLMPCSEDVLLDIGANIGSVSAAFLDAGIRAAIAIEPEPDNFRVLLNNLAPYQERAIALRAAVAAESGVGNLWLNQGPNKGTHSTVPRRGRPTITVRVVALAILLRQYRPSLLKVDIEGAEYALSEVLADLPGHVRGLAIELHLARTKWRTQLAPLIVQSLQKQSFIAAKQPVLAGRRPGSLSVWKRQTLRPGG